MSAGKRLQDRSELVLIALALLYFAWRVAYYALHIHPFVPPDEVTHAARVVAFSKSLLPPTDTPATHPLGLVTRVPTLYCFLMGKLLLLNLFGVPQLVFLRFLDVAMGVLTVVYGVRWVRLFSPDPLVRSLFVVMLTNTPMFVFLVGSVSYDNLTNLLGAAAIYYLYSCFATRSAPAFVAFLLCLALGCLTKPSFLPLALILVALLGLHERRSPGALPRALAASLRRPPPALAAALALLVTAGGLGVWLYGGNLVRYGGVIPRADQVIGLEAALRNRIFARNYVVSAYRRGELSREQAVEIARGISHSGDRSNTLELLEMVDDRRGRKRRAEPFVYAAVWTWQMLRSSVSLSGHAVLNKSAPELVVYLLIAGLACYGWLSGERGSGAGAGTGLAALIVLPYLLLLVWQVGYPAYRHTGAAGLAAQGRYAFPVLVPACGLLAHYLLAAVPPRVRLPTAVAVATWFVWQDFPWFLAHATPAWFMRG